MQKLSRIFAILAVVFAGGGLAIFAALHFPRVVLAASGQ